VSRPALKPPSLLHSGYRGPFPGGKACIERDCDHSPPYLVPRWWRMSRLILSLLALSWLSGTALLLHRLCVPHALFISCSLIFALRLVMLSDAQSDEKTVALCFLVFDESQSQPLQGLQNVWSHLSAKYFSSRIKSHVLLITATVSVTHATYYPIETCLQFKPDLASGTRALNILCRV
jgi:hypothetical protein